jgi:hypothetical protein
LKNKKRIIEVICNIPRWLEGFTKYFPRRKKVQFKNELIS